MFPKRLKELRKEKGYTQNELGKLVNVSHQAVGSWERGTRQPSYEIASKLADLFGVTVDDLLGKTKLGNYWDLNNKDLKDVGKELDDILSGMETDTDIAFYGEPMDEETRALVAQAIESNLRMARELAKKKYTRKDYREKDGE